MENKVASAPVTNDTQNTGVVTQIVGPVVDIRFASGKLPDLLTAIKIPLADDKSLTVEVAQGIGNDLVRCIAMGSTD